MRIFKCFRRLSRILISRLLIKIGAIVPLLKMHLDFYTQERFLETEAIKSKTFNLYTTAAFKFFAFFFLEICIITDIALVSLQ